MSVVFDLKDLDDKTSKKIVKALTFHPKAPPFQKFQKYQASTRANSNVPYKRRKDTTSFPILMSLILRKRFNQDKVFGKIYEDPNGKFTGKLLDRQKEPFKEAISYQKTQYSNDCTLSWVWKNIYGCYACMVS